MKPLRKLRPPRQEMLLIVLLVVVVFAMIVLGLKAFIGDGVPAIQGVPVREPPS